MKARFELKVSFRRFHRWWSFSFFYGIVLPDSGERQLEELSDAKALDPPNLVASKLIRIIGGPDLMKKQSLDHKSKVKSENRVAETSNILENGPSIPLAKWGVTHSAATGF
ncbi:hypothetical protein Syun_019141 [Stephania yunnanensis]|uniref:Uncharacterized protein n=1 Tax=Stephania yunnanensis TaxID=152371 RepID=A0AAP0NX09_9MAGN